VCDLEDNDCDGNTDVDAIDGTTYWTDGDDDGYGRDGSNRNYCSDPGGDWIVVGEDCDDGDRSVHPDAAEQCNHVDDDCDGQSDGSDPDTPQDQTFWLDADGDNHGDTNEPIAACLRPTGYVGNDEDCDDTNAARWAYVTGVRGRRWRRLRGSSRRVHALHGGHGLRGRQHGLRR
jgi:hypothetical protein